MDGDKPSVLGKYEASKTDIGANLFQKICMALARRWPENTFSGRGGFTYPSSGAEHGMIVEFKDGVLRYNILWMKNSDLREVCDRRFMERSALVSSGFPQMPTGPHALRHKKLSACMPSRSCRNACCMVTAEEQIYELKGDHFWLKEKRVFNEL